MSPHLSLWVSCVPICLSDSHVSPLFCISFSESDECPLVSWVSSICSEFHESPLVTLSLMSPHSSPLVSLSLMSSDWSPVVCDSNESAVVSWVSSSLSESHLSPVVSLSLMSLHWSHELPVVSDSHESPLVSLSLISPHWSYENPVLWMSLMSPYWSLWVSWVPIRLMSLQ